MGAGWQGERGRLFAVGLGLFRAVEPSPQFTKRIVVLVDDAFLERDDGVVGDGDVLRADVGTALGDVAVTDAVITLQLGGTILCV